MNLPLGPLMIDIEGLALTDLDRQRLVHPLVGGLILFSRNYASPQQLESLCAEVHALRQPSLPIAVDHEGGRVQRFREGFTRLPAMRLLGQLWDTNRATAIKAACGVGYVLAAELRARAVDLSFAPVLDLDYGVSAVIGDRAFHRQPAAVVELAGALIEGLRRAGMAACGKHFPGHGCVAADSHVAIPVDERDYAAIAAEDLAPYHRLNLDAIMPAHVIYPKVDANPAGFSKVWIDKLRQDFCFDGVIFSDDLSMEGASVAGGIIERATAAWNAGCDMLLVCNSPDLVEVLLLNWSIRMDPLRSRRIERLLPLQPASPGETLQVDPVYQAGLASVATLLPPR
jgi:beta-N-acetylhexosaminidase